MSARLAARPSPATSTHATPKRRHVHPNQSVDATGKGCGAPTGLTSPREIRRNPRALARSGFHGPSVVPPQKSFPCSDSNPRQATLPGLIRSDFRLSFSQARYVLRARADRPRPGQTLMSTATRRRHRVRFIPAGRQPRAAPLRWCASLVWRNQYLPVREPPDSE